MPTNRNDNTNRNAQGGRGSGTTQGGKQASGGASRSQGSGSMSVREAGQKGGQRVSELVEKGKRSDR